MGDDADQIEHQDGLLPDMLVVPKVGHHYGHPMVIPRLTVATAPVKDSGGPTHFQSPPMQEAAIRTKEIVVKKSAKPNRKGIKVPTLQWEWTFFRKTRI